MAELNFEKRLIAGWVGASPFIVVHTNPRHWSGWKKNFSWSFPKKTSFVVFNLKNGDIIAKKVELMARGLICHLTGDRWILFGYT